MSAEGCTVSENGSRLGITGIWVAPLAVLVGLWLWLAFSSGGYVPDRWLPPSLVLGLLGLVVSLLVVFPRRPGQLSLLVLALFACYGLWVALSAVWADSISRVWMESGRTFSYVLLFGLALVCLADPMARRMLRYLLMAATLANNGTNPVTGTQALDDRIAADDVLGTAVLGLAMVASTTDRFGLGLGIGLRLLVGRVINPVLGFRGGAPTFQTTSTLTAGTDGLPLLASGLADSASALRIPRHQCSFDLSAQRAPSGVSVTSMPASTNRSRT